LRDDGHAAVLAILPLVNGEAAVIVAEAFDGDLDVAFTD
jgi:hypothetical protein